MSASAIVRAIAPSSGLSSRASARTARACSAWSSCSSTSATARSDSSRRAGAMIDDMYSRTVERRLALQQQPGEPHDGRAVVAAGLADGVALAADGLGDVAHHLVEHAEGVPRVEGAHAGLRQVAVAAVVAELDGAAEALHGRAVLAAGGVDLPLEVVEVGEVRVRLEGVGQDVERLVPPLQRVEGGDDVPEQQRGVVRLERVELAEGAREVVERLLHPADPLELDAGVEEREGVDAACARPPPSRSPCCGRSSPSPGWSARGSRSGGSRSRRSACSCRPRGRPCP